jgi:hypothetical protein
MKQPYTLVQLTPAEELKSDSSYVSSFVTEPSNGKPQYEVAGINF